jgi:hypothetical protein
VFRSKKWVPPLRIHRSTFCNLIHKTITHSNLCQSVKSYDQYLFFWLNLHIVHYTS